METIKGKFNNKDKTRISVIYMFMIAVGFVNYMIDTLFDTGGMIVNLVILVLSMGFCYKTMVKVRFPAAALVLIIVIGLYFVITRQVSFSTVFGREFLVYFCLSSVLAMYKCDTEKILRYVSCISLVVLFFYNDIYIELNSTEYHNSISMGLSYALLPILMAPIFHFFYYRKERKQSLMYIVYAIALFLLVGICVKGTRGALVAVVVAICLVYIRGTKKIGSGRFHVARVVIVALVAILLIVYFAEVLGFLAEFFESLGIDAMFLKKTQGLMKAGDISNGRSEIFSYTIGEILKRPIFGHGIATMKFYGGEHSYAHNFILQLLYDGGVILAIPVLLIIGRAIYYVFCGEDEDEALFTLYMISITLPRAFFTGDIWENSLFWLFIMHSLAYHTIKKKVKFKRGMFAPVIQNEEEILPEGEI